MTQPGQFGPEALVRPALPEGTVASAPTGYTATFAGGNLTVAGPAADAVDVTITEPGRAPYTIAVPVTPLPSAVTAELADKLSASDASATYQAVFVVAAPTGVAATDTAAIQARINAAVTAGGGAVVLARGTYAINATLQAARGVTLRGSGMDDAAGTVLRLANGANCALVNTPFARGGVGTHFLSVEDMTLDGNGDNQTTEGPGLVDWQGAFVGSVLRNLLIKNARGPALNLWTFDGVVENVWVLNTSTTSAAVIVGHPTEPTETQNLATFDHFFVENTSSVHPNPGSTVLRTTPAQRGLGILIRQTNSLVFSKLHCESNAPDIRVTGTNKSMHFVSPSSSYSETVFDFDSAPRSLVIENLNSEQVVAPVLIDAAAGLGGIIPTVSGGPRAIPLVVAHSTDAVATGPRFTSGSGVALRGDGTNAVGVRGTSTGGSAAVEGRAAGAGRGVLAESAAGVSLFAKNTDANTGQITSLAQGVAGQTQPVHAVSDSDGVAKVAAYASGRVAHVGDAASTVTMGARVVGDSQDRIQIWANGLMLFGGGASGLDVVLQRHAPAVLGTDTGDCFRTGRNVTASRPSASAVGAGSQFYDTTLGKPIWSNGTVWRDAAGTAV